LSDYRVHDEGQHIGRIRFNGFDLPNPQRREIN
jgi:hypothetical protein